MSTYLVVSVIFMTCIGIITSLPMSIQNGVILDAGSSSTKIRIYAWTDAMDGVPTFSEVFYSKVYPGISAFADNLDGIDAYIQNILDVLTSEIPDNLHQTTPVYFMATAGMRLLDEHVTKSIMDAVHDAMDKGNNPFQFETENAHILAGEEEALFAWLTINYLEKIFREDSPTSDSFGLVELGGGSAQIAFIPDEPIYAGKMPVTVDGREYGVYCHSHLSFGSSMMAEKISQHLVNSNPDVSVLVNPCMLKGDSKNFTSFGKTVSMIGGGNASHCEAIIRHFLSPTQDELCSPKPCSIGQVYQPEVGNTRFYTFGLIYKVAKAFEALDNNGLLSLASLQTRVRAYCGEGLTEATTTWGMPSKYASANCQDGLYIPLLFNAFGFPLNTQTIMAIGTSNGVKIGWSLGAMVYEEERLRYQQFSNIDG